MLVPAGLFFFGGQWRVWRHVHLRAKHAPSLLVRFGILSHENSLRSDTHGF